ncbi:ferrous iron transport protein A [Mobilisporobacter senegalensis]|uniref:Ferrous iron transport protein A n=1 Tax=Mobilisporobacter senegalensis TaxID=1329262 RepID=A0A3N1XBN1_9FIRM|nr:ferrous iron transport protein A [Mobilisporobacter senegalensis]
MMRKLCEVEIGAMAKVENILAKDILKERLLALGLTKGSFVEVLRKGPKDNLTVYKIRGAMIALRKEESSLINVN